MLFLLLVLVCPGMCWISLLFHIVPGAFSFSTPSGGCCAALFPFVSCVHCADGTVLVALWCFLTPVTAGHVTGYLVCLFGYQGRQCESGPSRSMPSGQGWPAGEKWGICLHRSVFCIVLRKWWLHGRWMDIIFEGTVSDMREQWMAQQIKRRNRYWISEQSSWCTVRWYWAKSADPRDGLFEREADGRTDQLLDR